MTEQDRAPLIRLPIDQEVYMDTVQEGTTVEDATVATEVVSFERIGDAYVLEGAIVFAGYISREVANDTDETVVETGSVEHFHQRLPFVLRVPIRAQPRGILNVKSRLSGWQLRVAGRGWLRVAGDLQVAGLSSDEGYHFECGGQQLGHPLFEMSIRKYDEDTTEQQGQNHEPIGNEDPQVQEDPPLFRSNLEKEGFEEVVEKMSEARHGYGLGEASDLPEMSAKEDQPTVKSEVAEIRAVDDLANFDRFFTNNAYQEVPTDKDISEIVPLEERQVEKQSKTLAEFEFEHQLSPEEMAKLEKKAPPAKVQNETFVASRSFTNDGFQAAAGFSHRYSSEFAQPTEQSIAGHTDECMEFDANSVSDEQSTERFEDGSTQNLWSFVDFNGPDTKYTLRYVIVVEEETLEAIADRIHCTKSELMRVNKLEIETITPGQTLLIPETSFTFAK